MPSEKEVRHAEEENYTGPRILAYGPDSRGPDTLCGIPWHDVPKGHWITHNEKHADCQDCLAIIGARPQKGS
jgi:hypothetical protein